MSVWRRVALERLPDCRRQIESAPSVMALWIELWLEFCRAYNTDPPDDDRIRRIYDYAWWCLEGLSSNRDANHDAATAAMVCFFEHVPTLNAARADLQRWFNPATFLSVRSAFSYFLSEGQMAELDAEFLAKTRRRGR